MNKFSLAFLGTSALVLVACSAPEQTNPYGEDGWQDSEDLTSIVTINAKGDNLNTAATQIFNIWAYTLVAVFEGPFKNTCKKSEAGTSEMGGNLYKVDAKISFPEDEHATINLGERNIIYRTEEKAGGANAMLFLGAESKLFAPVEYLQPLSQYSKADLTYTDKCEKAFVVNFNTSGDPIELAKSLPTRKQEAINAEAEKEFE